MRALVLGTGAMGTSFAAGLARSGVAVTLAGTWAAALEAAARDGLGVEQDGEVWSARVEVRDVDAALPEADLTLVLVKSWQTPRIAAVAARAGAPILTLQNGLGNVEALEAAAGGGRVSAGVTTEGATLLAPGRVKRFPATTSLGAGPRGEWLARVLRAAGFDTTLVPDVDALRWLKLAVNCAINPLTALLGFENGALLLSPLGSDLMARAAREVGAVAAAKGINLGVDPARYAVEVAERTAANRSSMLQDVERGRPTEIDALCGALVREAEALGVPAPVNAWLCEEVRRREGRRAA